MAGTASRTEKLDLRLTAAAKRALQMAAAAERRSVSEFVLDSALSRAEEMLVNRRRFSLNAKQWQAFQAALDADPRDLPRIKKLFAKASVFEGGTK
ncbi:MAG: DUF1778 domain-containing protein [Gammaproteobacteria bacterium PRO9]|nr:DUF1778 domain-containing protein [Gammaproteobacteria bacterium PRO9]